MWKLLVISVAATMLVACGGDEDDANNANNVNNVNNVNNSNNANNANNSNNANNVNNTNNANNANNSNNNSGAGTATINLTMTADQRTQVLTECSFAMGTANEIVQRDNVDQPDKIGLINCQAQETGSFTAFYVFELQFLSSATGTTMADDVDFTCGVTGCTGNVRIELSYQDGAAGILDSAWTVTAESQSGSFTLDTFDTTTGAVSGSVDYTMTEDNATLSLSGTFSANLYDCGSTSPCTGNM